MSKLQDLMAQREALEKAIEAARQEEIKQAVETVRGLVKQFKLTSADIFGGKTKAVFLEHHGEVLGGKFLNAPT